MSTDQLSLLPVPLPAASWEGRWKKSTWKKSEGSQGEFKLTAGKWYGDAEADKGIQTGPDSKYFATYAELTKTLDNTGKDLVLQVGQHGLAGDLKSAAACSFGQAK